MTLVWIRVGSIGAACLLLATCAIPARPALPDTPATLDVRLSEYRIDYLAKSRLEVRAGRVVFDVENKGALPHEMTLLELPKDFKGTLLQEVRTPPRAAFVALARLPKREPGERGFFAIDLPPGRYGLICLLSAPDGASYARKGMVAEFTVVG